MSFYDLSTRLQQLSVKEVTTMSNISYLPTSVGLVQASMNNLKKLKANWGIEILENDLYKEIQVGNKFKITVPKEHWNHFYSNFGKDLELIESKKLNENTRNKERKDFEKTLKEAVADDMYRLRKDLKGALIRMFNESPFSNINYIFNIWVNIFGIASYMTPKGVAVSVEGKKPDIQRLYGNLLRTYGYDKGNLEMALEAIDLRRPLNAFDVFKDFEFLYGTRVNYSLPDGTTLILELLVDMAFIGTASLNISNPDILDAVEEQSVEVKRVGSVLYPVEGKFTKSFFDLLKEIIEDME